jgi:hypothetical protein
MRISFAAMAASWVLACAAFWLSPAAAIAASVVAFGLTSIWAAHITARSTRVVRFELPENYSRRLAMRTALVALAGAALVSAGSSKARADGYSACGGWGGGPESGCKPCPSNCYRQGEECGCVRCDTCCQGGGEC